MKNTNKQVIVPQHDIDRIETSRKRLWELFPEGKDYATLSVISLINITNAMWHLTHRKYPSINSDLTDFRKPIGSECFI